MDAIAGVSFRDPSLLWWLAAAPLALVWLLARERRRMLLAHRFISSRLRGVSNGVRAARPWVLAASLALLIVALAGPQLGSTTMPVESLAFNRIFVVDLSNSMGARDVGTSRLSAAKAVIRRLIEQTPGRVGLVVFEGTAEVISPLTSDTAAVVTLLDSLALGEMAEPGSDLGRGIEAALELAESVRLQGLDLVLVSDGEDQGNALPAAIAHARRQGVAVHTVLIGTAEGGPIPDGQRDLRDADGRVVITRADPRTMERIARETNGRFAANPFGGGIIERLQRDLSPTGAATSRSEVQMPIERFQWPLALGLVGLILAGVLNRGAE
jgi:Ca-activated chloride channel homolog